MHYICANCRSTASSYALTCPDCGGWNSLSRTTAGNARALPVALPDIATIPVPRRPTHLGPFDALLGGGIVPGSAILLAGPPGAGKSTLVLQVLRAMNLTALYATGEESVLQLKMRADRLQIVSKNLFLLAETNVQRIVAQVGAVGAQVLVIDSIQTMYSESSGTLPGSTTQLRRCTYLLRKLAQERDLTLILVGQVTKANAAAGPRTIEHAVDVVLMLDAGMGQQRTLVATKNRFGSTAPACRLSMHISGLAFDAAPA